MERQYQFLIGFGIIIFIIGLVYANGGINPNGNLYSAQFSYRANNPLEPWQKAYLSQMAVGSYVKQGLFTAYTPRLLFIWQDYKTYITVVCDGVQVYYVEDFATHVRQGTYVERQLPIKNLPSGARCKLTARMFRKDENFEHETSTSFTVPGQRETQ